jgi:hypothetical protein
VRVVRIVPLAALRAVKNGSQAALTKLTEADRSLATRFAYNRFLAAEIEIEI